MPLRANPYRPFRRLPINLLLLLGLLGSLTPEIVPFYALLPLFVVVLLLQIAYIREHGIRDHPLLLVADSLILVLVCTVSYIYKTGG